MLILLFLRQTTITLFHFAFHISSPPTTLSYLYLCTCSYLHKNHGCNGRYSHGYLIKLKQKLYYLKDIPLVCNPSILTCWNKNSFCIKKIKYIYLVFLMLNVRFTIFHPLNPFPHKHHPSLPNSYAHHPPKIEHPPSKEEKH